MKAEAHTYKLYEKSRKCGITKRNDNSIATKFKDMEYYDLTDKEFKIAVRKKLNKL